MARGPDGQGGGAGASLADQIFNEGSIADLARDYSVLPRFDTEAFQAQANAGLSGRGFLERLEWLADCLEAQLPSDFPAMAEALHAAMPPPLDPTKTDDDFGRWIHAVPGTLAVRHGLEDHRNRALDLIHAATQRFSMEYAIRPFLNRWPEETLARLDLWAQDDNYHVRRLVSEGTRPRLPWARNITLDPAVPLRFLDALHGDPARFVTRSVANHMNDLSKVMPDRVLDHLRKWQDAGRQTDKELAWMTRHALRTAVKRGERGALDHLGYRAGQVQAQIVLEDANPRIGEMLELSVTLTSPETLLVMVDYRLRFHRPSGTAEKVFKLKATKLKAGHPLTLTKAHKLKGNATTFTLHPGPHAVTIQVNGQDVASARFELSA
ncbi:DNA alkylation repair protein [Tropicibacter naphthalenivorans]|uniref:DNA alkylation repair enzyme n=1 Tax=Tropicibacter naphthalenivorans TaxID=441103 RepID=A0A0P1G5J6_9RHOB|nr:DNA alkylation repair protein [Tropicibacter naphthalenivorans]CUH77046.1 DNA alkylation repair enzyme [Tropicibacter naphthalenivorans]SMC61290.1 3-methyladenine DNA glycosylase AlkC [Tropicibacter naphthalenivorans]